MAESERKTREEKGDEEKKGLKGCNEGWIEERISKDERDKEERREEKAN